MASSSSSSSSSSSTACSPSSSSSSSSSPCAACKFLRRKCMPGCIFAPYFPPEDPQKFINVHKIFGASNVAKLLNELLPAQREDAVNSLAYEADARIKDPVYGCVGAISVLQRHVHRLQKELDAANADLLRYADIAGMLPAPPLPPPPPPILRHHHHHHHPPRLPLITNLASYPPTWITTTTTTSGTAATIISGNPHHQSGDDPMNQLNPRNGGGRSV